MSKIEQLLKKLCPNGVEYKKLWEIATDIYRGSGILRTKVATEGVPCVCDMVRFTRPMAFGLTLVFRTPSWNTFSRPSLAPF